MATDAGRSLVRSQLAALLPLVAIVLVAAGCGGSSGNDRSSGSAGQQGDPAAAAREFISALVGEDAVGFCSTTLPSIQRPNFATAQVPPGGSCVERAEAMFDFRQPGGTKPSWALLSEAKVGAVKLTCASGTERCPTAIAELENLPIPGGETTSAPLPLTYTGGGWKVGAR